MPLNIKGIAGEHGSLQVLAQLLKSLYSAKLRIMKESKNNLCLTTRTGNLQARYAGLKDSKINTITSNSTHSHKVSQFHKYLKQANGPKVNELQTTSLSGKDFDCLQFLQALANELQFEITYVDIDEKSVSGKYQCLLQISTVPLAVCFGTGNSPKEAQTSAAFNALEYLKITTRK